ncbi:MAG TPA: hypothetical protein VND64_35790 [Pirellulales bacterium]|nr:hypothetical protein [Pirellulales bacterium]
MFNARNLAACLQGGRQPHHAALAVVLGLLAGFVTGWNLTLAVVLLAVVVFNVRTRTFLAAWAIGLGGAWLLAGLTYRLGHLLLDSTPLGECVAALGDGPWVALLEWDRYTLVGGACLAGALSLVASRLAAWLARTRGGTVGEPRGLLRPLGAVGAVGLLVATGVVTSHLVSARVEREFLSQLTEANGAPAAVDEFHFSLWTGRLRISDLQLADPRRLDRDRLRIGRVTAQLRAGDLVRGRLNVDTLILEHLRGDVARRQPAESDEFAPPIIEMPSFDETDSAPTHETIELDGFLRNWPALRDRLAACEPWVKALGNLSACDEDSMSLCRERSDLGRRRPRVFVAKLRAAGLASSWGLGARATLEASRLSSRPTGLDEPTRIEIVAPECGTEISAEMDPRDESARIAIKLHSHGLALDDLVDLHQTEGLLDVADGAVRLAGEGWIDGSGLELSLHVEIDSLDAHVTGQQALAGISAAVWDDGLRRLGALRTDVLLSGTWDSPTVTADRRRVVEQFKHQLRAAGEHQLVKAIEEQLTRTETAPPLTATEMVEAVDPQLALDEGTCRISDLVDTSPPRYPYPSTDDEFVDRAEETLPSIDDTAPRQPCDSRAAGPVSTGPETSYERSGLPSVSPDLAADATAVTPAAEAVVPQADQPNGAATSGTATSVPTTSEPLANGPTTSDPDVTPNDTSAAPDTHVPSGHDAAPTTAEQNKAEATENEDQDVGDQGAAAGAETIHRSDDQDKTFESATVRRARPSAARRRTRKAAGAKPEPAPSWEPTIEPDPDTLDEPTNDDDGETAAPRQPVERKENWFSRFSKGIRNKFNRRPPPHRSGPTESGEPGDMDEPANDEPAVTDASSYRSDDKKPWFKIFRR